MRPIQVIEIVQEPGVDGFKAKLENGNSVEVSFTMWNSLGYREVQEDGSTIFNAPNGLNIVFRKDQIENL
jgi:hypothetical protein